MASSLYIEFTEYLKEQISHCDEIILRRKEELQQETDELVIEFINESIQDWTTARNNFNDLLQAREI